MSTRAFIIQKVNHEFKTIYLHFDGYLEYTGVILQSSYNTPQKVTQLTDMGGCSSLGSSIEPPESVKRFGFSGILTKEFERLEKEEQERLKKNQYSSDNSIFYHRDRDEQLEIISFHSIHEIMNARLMIAFTYIFMYEQWWILDEDGHLKSLKKTLQRKKIEF